MISHRHKFIFIHVPKTGGYSISHAICAMHKLSWNQRSILLGGDNDNPAVGPFRLSHMTWDQYLSYQYAPEWMFDQYFKFSIVRNPWDRVTSMFRVRDVVLEKFTGRTGLFPSFESFVESLHTHHSIWNNAYWVARPQSEYIFDEANNCMVDFVGKFEHLQDSYGKICTNIDVQPIKLGLRNVSNHKNKPYQEYYTPETREMVRDMYQRDIELLNYTFE